VSSIAKWDFALQQVRFRYDLPAEKQEITDFIEVFPTALPPGRDQVYHVEINQCKYK
jgi:hypothetical protein